VSLLVHFLFQCCDVNVSLWFFSEGGVSCVSLSGRHVQWYFLLLIIIKNIKIWNNEKSHHTKQKKANLTTNHPSSLAEMLGLGNSNTSTLTSVLFTSTTSR
jgi:hypothetical protein